MRRRFYSRQSAGPYVSVIFDKSISNPANITIEDNESVLDSILSQFRRCLCKKTAEGEVAICYLDDESSYFYEDQSYAELNGEEGDTMVNFPEFWYKWVKIDNNRFAYRFALSDIESDWKHVKRSLVGAYKAVEVDNKLYSRSGVTPSTGISCNKSIQIAESRGSGYQIIDFQQHCVIAFMLYAKYKTRDLQAILGTGGAIYSPATQTGDSNMTGIKDTKNETSKYTCGLGLEGVFGGIYEWVSAVVIKDVIWTITDPDGSIRKVIAVGQNGWIKNISAEKGPYFDIIPVAVGGSNSTYYSDSYQTRVEQDLALARSCFNSIKDAGVAYTHVNDSILSNRSDAGTRLSFRGIIHEIQDSSEFKSLPLL